MCVEHILDLIRITYKKQKKSQLRLENSKKNLIQLTIFILNQ